MTTATQTNIKKGTSTSSTVSELKMKIVFASFSLCGVTIPRVCADLNEIGQIKNRLIREGLLNPEDDLENEIKCPFYRQMVQGILIEEREIRDSKNRNAA